MNKYSFHEIKLGDIYEHVNGGLWLVTSVIEVMEIYRSIRVNDSEIQNHKVGDIAQLWREDQSSLFNPLQFRGQWNETEVKRPSPGQQVIVARPNKYSTRIDFLIATFHEKVPGGKTYGKSYAPRITYDDYWSLPAIVVLQDCPYWAEIPNFSMSFDELV